MNKYSISGPSSFIADTITGGSISGIALSLQGSTQYFGISTSYNSGEPITSGITFSNTTLSTMGFTTTGLIGTWQLDGTPGADGQINVYVNEVPGPLPLLGSAAAFSWSRRLRRRVSASTTTSNA
jgi:hypothetical protein